MALGGDSLQAGTDPTASTDSSNEPEQDSQDTETVASNPGGNADMSGSSSADVSGDRLQAGTDPDAGTDSGSGSGQPESGVVNDTQSELSGQPSDRRTVEVAETGTADETQITRGATQSPDPQRQAERQDAAEELADANEQSAQRDAQTDAVRDALGAGIGAAGQAAADLPGAVDDAADEFEPVSQAQVRRRNLIGNTGKVNEQAVVDASGDVADFARDTLVSPAAGFVGSQVEQSTVGVGVEQTDDGLRLTDEIEGGGLTDTTPETQVGKTTENFATGAGNIATTPLELPATAINAKDTAADAAEFTVENPSEAPGAAADTTVNFAKQQAQAIANNPARTAGSLVASAGIFGAARRVGTRASRTTRAAIQPGEELLGSTLNRVPKVGDRLAPNSEPIIFSEEAAIRTAKAAGRKARAAGDRIPTRDGSLLASDTRGQFDLAGRGSRSETETERDIERDVDPDDLTQAFSPETEGGGPPATERMERSPTRDPTRDQPDGGPERDVYRGPEERIKPPAEKDALRERLAERDSSANLPPRESSVRNFNFESETRQEAETPTLKQESGELEGARVQPATPAQQQQTATDALELERQAQQSQVTAELGDGELTGDLVRDVALERRDSGDRVDTGTEIDTETGQELEQEFETELEQELEQESRSESELEQETEIELEAESRRETEVGTPLDDSSDEGRRRGFGGLSSEAFEIDTVEPGELDEQLGFGGGDG